MPGLPLAPVAPPPAVAAPRALRHQARGAGCSGSSCYLVCGAGALLGALKNGAAVVQVGMLFDEGLQLGPVFGKVVVLVGHSGAGFVEIAL